MTASKFATTLAFVLATLSAVSCDQPRKDAKPATAASDSQLWSRRVQCRELAQAKIASDEVSQQQAARRGEDRLLRFAPEYCFSEAFNTCICDEHWIGDVYEYRAVIDLLRGRKLAEFRTDMGGPKNRQELQEQENFEKKRQQLFAGCAK